MHPDGEIPLGRPANERWHPVFDTAQVQVEGDLVDVELDGGLYDGERHQVPRMKDGTPPSFIVRALDPDDPLGQLTQLDQGLLPTQLPAGAVVYTARSIRIRTSRGGPVLSVAYRPRELA